MYVKKKFSIKTVVLLVAGVFLLFGIINALSSHSDTPSKITSSEDNLQSSKTETTTAPEDKTLESESSPTTSVIELTQPPVETYVVLSVVDGDTIKVNYQGSTTSVRLIGVNTPETVDPRKSVECFGQEASQFLKNKLTGKTVTLAADASQTDRDKYNRLLRYVYLDDEDVNLTIIKEGYGYEYTYNIPYQKQAVYKAAQKQAEANKRGLWADNACVKTTVATTTTTATTTNNAQNCKIKGNISKSGEKIYHMPGQQYYDKTKIDMSAGERWFCTEAEAVQAGWRKSKR